MDHRQLGRTGVSVSTLCLGTMMFGAQGTEDHDESIRIIHRALDAGITFVDPANVSSSGESEVIVGKALQGRDDVVLTTKFFMPFDNDPNHRGASRRWVIQAVENSLRRLGTDHLDLYQIHLDLYQMHHYDPDVDHPRRAQRPGPSGTVRSLGHSTFPPRRSSMRSASPATAAGSGSSSSSPHTRS